ncbi:hypothetical protein chiPu_0032375 [Chiloscyllium punctatum]|uniref:Uncharacterized protein n=1 Tax=Chiloscyllium punctatum TaxID=137246 RepID=A0A401U0C1_CHIPU|nr:hypothetical protein [Chiloscyllium punctatum]
MRLGGLRRDRNIGAVTRRPQRDREPNAAARTRDEQRLAFERCHENLLPRPLTRIASLDAIRPLPQGERRSGASGTAITSPHVLPTRMQHAAARFRQRVGGDEEHGIGRDREDRDRVGERRRGRQRADQERKQRADAAAEIVAEALA